MNKPTFKDIILLNIQNLTNFPYIEKDFDALTDYGLLCKVVDKMNEVISNNNIQNESINALYDAFIELKDYVDNLDLQEEVNNKLEDMATSGELTNLIAGYVDPIYTAYETKINNEIYNKNYNNFVFGFCPWIYGSNETSLNKVFNFLKGSGCKYYELWLNIINTDGVLSLKESDEEIIRTLTIGAEKNLYPYIIKFHQNTLDLTDSDLPDKYVNQVRHVLNIVEDYCEVEYITVLNEYQTIYTSSTYDSIGVSILQQIHSLGYKTSISFAGCGKTFTGSILYATHDILNACDFFAVNSYFKGCKTAVPVSVEENYIAMNTIDSGTFEYVVQLCNQYNKRVIISECGTGDYWLSLCKPDRSSVSGETITYGEAVNVYFISLMKYLNQYQEYIIAAFWWYVYQYDTLDYSKFQNSILKFVGGIE